MATLSQKNHRLLVTTALVCICVILAEPIVLSSPSWSGAAAYQTNSDYPSIKNFTVNVSQSESKTIYVPVDNLGSNLNWTSLRLSFERPPKGIEISTDPLLFEDGFVQARSDNYSLQIGISVGANLSLGSYTIPFSLLARSSITPPYTATSLNFNLILTVSKSAPAPFPIIFLYISVIFLSGLSTVGIVLVWSKEWNLSEIKKR